MVVALVALFVALGGTSYAVIKLPARSVGNRELKNNAVTSAKVRPGVIARSDLSPNARTGSRGSRGAVGPQGPPGRDASTTIEAWKPLQLIGGWVPYGDDWPTPGYRKDAGGRVFLRGLLKRMGGITGASETMAILPAGYLPAARTMQTAVTANGSGTGSIRLDLGTNGELRWIGGPTGDPNFVSLDSISFASS